MTNMKTETLSATMEEYTVVPFHPTIEGQFNHNGETLLKTTYYGEQMRPILLPGDNMILRKLDHIPLCTDGIYMIEYGESLIVCRLNQSNEPGHIYARYENPDLHLKGWDVPLKNVQGLWQLVTSQRMHDFKYATIYLPKKKQ